MSDGVSILDIIIRMRADGKGDEEVKQKLLGLGLAARDVEKALGGQTQETKKVEEAQKGLTPVIEKATTAKKDYKDSVKGLALEFPLLARGMALLSNPLSALIAMFGTVVGLVYRYSESVRQAGMASQEFERARTSVADLAAELRDAIEDSDAFAKSFDGIRESVQGAIEKLNEFNAALLLKQRLEGKLDDATLNADVQKIQNDPKLSDAQKIRAIAEAQSKARIRTADREDSTQQQTADNEAVTAHYEGQRAKKLKAQAEGMAPAIGKATAETKASANEAAGFPESQKKAREENARILEMVRRLQEAGKGGTTAIAGTLAMHPFDAKLLADKYPPGPGRNLETIEKELLAAQKGSDSQAEGVTQRAKDKAMAEKDLRDEQKRLQTEATKAETTSAQYERSSKTKYHDLETSRAYRGKTEPVVEMTEAEKARRAADEKNRQAQESFDKEDEEFDRMKEQEIQRRIREAGRDNDLNRAPGGDPNRAPGGASFDGAGIAAAIGEGTNELQGLGEDILSALNEQSRTIAGIRAGLKRTESNQGYV